MRRLRRTYQPSLGEHCIRRQFMSGNPLLNNNCNSNTNEGDAEVPIETGNIIDEQGTQEVNSILNLINTENMEQRLTSLSHRNISALLENFTPNDQDETKLGRILRSVREVISCCACYSSDSIMKECTNGHLICQNCFLTLRQDERPQCPTCRANLYSDSRRALVAQKVLAELPDICTDCNTQMLHKSLPNHRLNSCPKRRVACGLSALGCEWTGCADAYDAHYHECNLRRQLAEQTLGDNFDWLVTRFKKREQTMRETFHCFSNVLRHLDAHELQTITVTLANVSTTDSALQYRSDHFHVNQSRWTAEINMSTGDEQPVQEPMENQVESNNQGTEDQGSVSSDQSAVSDNLEMPGQYVSGHPGLLQSSNQHVIRRRRWHQGPSLRHHPYQLPTSGLPVPSTLQTAARSTVQAATESTCTTTRGNVSPTTDFANLGEITYRMLKENSPGIGRRAYSFVLLQIKVPDTGIQIYARPQLQSYRYASRGDHSANFTVHPIRWRHLSSLRELEKYRIIQAEFVIARRLVDDHVEN